MALFSAFYESYSSLCETLLEKHSRHFKNCGLRDLQSKTYHFDDLNVKHFFHFVLGSGIEAALNYCVGNMRFWLIYTAILSALSTRALNAQVVKIGKCNTLSHQLRLCENVFGSCVRKFSIYFDAKGLCDVDVHEAHLALRLSTWLEVNKLRKVLPCLLPKSWRCEGQL